LACLIDTEHAYDPKWAEEIGVDTEELIYKQPETGEEAIDIAEVMIRAGVDLIVFDSVAAALPQAEQQKRLHKESVQPARLAQLMSLAMRKLTAANGKTAVLWINQTRINVGVMFGSNEAVPGGKALPFYASFRIACRKAGKVTEDIEVHVTEAGSIKKKKIKHTVAQTIRTTLEKSKLNQPHREVLFNFDFRRGQVDGWLYLVHKALDQDVLATERKQWWLTSDPKTKYRGIEELRKVLSENTLRRLLEIPATVATPKPLPDLWKAKSPGATKPAKNKGAQQKSGSSKRVVRVSTRVAVREGSKKTVVVKRKSSKSKMRTRRSP
jgi:recombination protein RecA